MFKTTLVSWITLLVLCSSLNAQNKPDYFTEVLDSGKEGPDYLYKIQDSNNDSFVDYEYDPRRSPGNRLNIIDVFQGDEGYCLKPYKFCDTPSTKDIQLLELELEKDFWCSSITDSALGEVVLESETKITATYIFDAIYKNKELDGVPEIGPMSVYVTIDKKRPAVLAYTMHLKYVINPVPFFRVTGFNVEVECARAPDGRTYMAKKNTYIIAEFGYKELEEIYTKEIYKLEPVTVSTEPE